jgi:hypothetical protein
VDATIWMEHDVHGGRALLPDLPYWRANGWNPCDGPPVMPSTLRDPIPDPEPEAPETPPSAGSSAGRPAEAGDDEAAGDERMHR